jgi:hypothetical protein
VHPDRILAQPFTRGELVRDERQQFGRVLLIAGAGSPTSLSAAFGLGSTRPIGSIVWVQIKWDRG